jgi:heptosyltransferase-3
MIMRMLLLRPGAIGDSLLTFPILHALKATLPGVHLTFVSNMAVIPLARSWQLADTVYDYSDPLWSELFSTTGIASPMLHDLLSNTDAALCWLRDPDGLVAHNLLATGIGRVMLAPGRPAEGTRTHIVTHLAQTAGVDVDEHMLVQPARTRPDGPIAVHPGSGGAHKCWPVASFAQVVQQLWQRSIPVLLLGGPADTERITLLLHALPTPSPAPLLSVLLNAPLPELAAALQQCRGYVGNDSGITHLAALAGVPTLALFGPSDPHTWRPVGPAVSILYEPELTQLSVERVMEAIEERL